jgi:hypothetical protein
MTPKQLDLIKKMTREKNLRKNIFEKSFNRVSRANAIKAKCLDCCCFVTQEITNCTVETCPLWSYRPYTKNEAEFEIELSEEGEN